MHGPTCTRDCCFSVTAVVLTRAHVGLRSSLPLMCSRVNRQIAVVPPYSALNDYGTSPSFLYRSNTDHRLASLSAKEQRTP